MYTRYKHTPITYMIMGDAQMCGILTRVSCTLFWIYLFIKARVSPANCCHLEEFCITTYGMCQCVIDFMLRILSKRLFQKNIRADIIYL